MRTRVQHDELTHTAQASSAGVYRHIASAGYRTTRGPRTNNGPTAQFVSAFNTSLVSSAPLHALHDLHSPSANRYKSRSQSYKPAHWSHRWHQLYLTHRAQPHLEPASYQPLLPLYISSVQSDIARRCTHSA